MKALLAKSQFVEVEGLTAFGPRFLHESLKLRARTLVLDDFFPMLVALCKLTQLIKHSATLGVTEFWHFLDDLGCAQREIIASVINLSGASLSETFFDEKGQAAKAAPGVVGLQGTSCEMFSSFVRNRKSSRRIRKTNKSYANHASRSS